IVVAVGPRSTPRHVSEAVESVDNEARTSDRLSGPGIRLSTLDHHDAAVPAPSATPISSPFLSITRYYTKTRETRSSTRLRVDHTLTPQSLNARIQRDRGGGHGCVNTPRTSTETN
ncbi:uncharacterized protein SCHCODRAFT_02472085, partial [Schizophyllum commune H4-8]|uniref:uncharacterized protein n=1 Tax=Schizophyllum commune (strain H4-8 / FGSC 9210) TaxID=578458 RepID=UPI00215F4831